GRGGGQPRAAPGAGVGRARRSLHQHHPGDGDEPAPQARRPAGDRDRGRLRLPDRHLMTVKPTVRLKLTMAYGGLFLLAGAILLTLNYALVRSSLGKPAPQVGVTFTAPAAGLSGKETQVFVGSAGVPRPGVTVPEPVTPDGRKVSDVLRDLTNSYRNKTLHQLVVKSLQALGLMGLVSVGFGWGLSGRVLSPLHRMTAAARRLSEEDLHERIALDGPDDELKELADTFDAMLGRLEAAFESQKRFVANASHELR